jgi:hypothetical protein
MNYNTKCCFQEGKGVAYRHVYHLLHGTKTKLKEPDTHGDCLSFYDANIKGYGRGSADIDIDEINDLELQSEMLSPGILDLRTMVDFCCIWRYDYPDSIHHICKAIGGSGNNVSRCHYQVGTDKRDELTAYASALREWLVKNGDEGEGSKENSAGVEDIAQRVFTMLGTKEEIKKLLVERTLLGLASRNIDCSFYGSDREGTPVSLYPFQALDIADDWKAHMSSLEKEIIKGLGSDAYDFLCEVGGAEPPCHFKFIRRLEILIGSIGCLKWRGYLPPKDSKVSGRREVTQRYLSVLNSFWREIPLEKEAGNDDLNQSLKKEIFDELGESTANKRWLAASLWKNIKNQTTYQAFTMKRWVEFVQITRNQIQAS